MNLHESGKGWIWHESGKVWACIKGWTCMKVVRGGLA